MELIENNMAGLVLPGLEKALKDECFVKIFSSGFGLRMVQIERNGVLKASGEHINLIPALFQADNKYIHQQNDYICEHYNGSDTFDCRLDWFINYLKKDIVIYPSKAKNGIIIQTSIQSFAGFSVAEILYKLNTWFIAQGSYEEFIQKMNSDIIIQCANF